MSTCPGLSSVEARLRLVHYGPNTLTSPKRNPFGLFLSQFHSPLIYLLILAATVSFLLDSKTDAYAITAILFINAVIGFLQEYKSERLVEKLEGLIANTTIVRRDGKEITIAEPSIVPGDLLILREGDNIPADAVISIAESVIVDESSISGESIPIHKRGGDTLYAGTILVHGSCEATVTATGDATGMGKAMRLAGQTRKKSSFEEGTTLLSNSLMRVILVVLIILFGANLFLKAHSGIHFENMLLFTLALAISIVPEALPVIVTLTLSSGAFALTKRHVIVKRLSAVEDLGNVDILCTDKTGTITENSVQIKHIYPFNPHRFWRFTAAVLDENNPMDQVIKKQIPITERKPVPTRLETLAFDPTARRRWSIIIDDGVRYLVVFGSAEEIIKLSSPEPSGVGRDIQTEEKNGFRAIGIGYKRIPAAFSLDGKFDDSGLTYGGRFIIHDPIRKTAAATIKNAESLHVSVKIITGDSLPVARYTAQEVGLSDTSGSGCYDRGELEAMDDAAFANACRTGTVFARISPELKLRIVETLKNTSVVAYQGDGINDAPALKAATVGIAVHHAQDIAKEAADIILLETDLSVIVEGIRSGRKIFANINKYIKHTMVSNWGNFFGIAVISLMTDYLPLLPIQIILSSLFSDLPQMAVATDSVDRDELMKPAHYDRTQLVTVPLILGAITACFTIFFYLIFRQYPTPLAQTMWFLLITTRDLVIVISTRKRGWMFSGKPMSRPLFFSIAAAITAIFVLPSLPIHSLFHLVMPNGLMYGFIVISTCIYIVFLDAIKVSLYGLLQHRSSR